MTQLTEKALQLAQIREQEIASAKATIEQHTASIRKLEQELATTNESLSRVQAEKETALKTIEVRNRCVVLLW